MLRNLHIKNMALIREADVDFGPGLNILTGETGAGKSVIVDAIGLALGERSTRELGKEGSALVELVFETSDTALCERLQLLGVEAEDGMVFISRRFTDGRSLFRVNGETRSAREIRNLAPLLLDIHGQSEHQKLLKSDTQLALLDSFGRKEILPLKEAYQDCFRRWRQLKEELGNEELNPAERERQLSFLEFEIAEIEDAALREGEDEELEKRMRKLQNARKIAEAADQAHRASGYDAGDSAGEQIGTALKKLESVLAYDDELNALYEQLSEVESLLQDFNRELASYAEDLSFDEETFAKTEERLDLINRLKNRYGNSIGEIAEALTDKKEEAGRLRRYEERRSRLSAEFSEAEKMLFEAAGRLTNARKKSAALFSEKAESELEGLNFAAVRFDIHFEELSEPARSGTDAVDFVIATNPGQPLRPLRQVVSGGELSRIMLGIRTMFAGEDATETLIFDEIDAGISGRTAQMAAEKLAELSKRHQVFCITHLPQIAAMADAHYCITKKISADAAETGIEALDEEEAVRELARLLGGAEITENTLKNAREMKFMCRQFRDAEL